MLEYDDLETLISECKKCQKCPLRKLAASQVVPGEGNPHAQIMFIGEGPGATEDKLGRPFVGAAGKFLDIMLASIGIKREDVYIANMVKCRPPQNRDPQDVEKEACRPWLDEQIRLINPKVFVPLGRHALNKFLPNMSIGMAHGKIFAYQGKVIYASYHPAVALYNGSMRNTLIADIKILKDYLEGKVEPQQYSFEELVDLRKKPCLNSETLNQKNLVRDSVIQSDNINAQNKVDIENVKIAVEVQEILNKSKELRKKKQEEMEAKYKATTDQIGFF